MRFVILFAFISFYSFGQNEKTEIEIDLLYTNSKFFNKTFHGASVGISGHLNERTALGFFASFYNKDINPTFYNVGEMETGRTATSTYPANFGVFFYIKT